MPKLTLLAMAELPFLATGLGSARSHRGFDAGPGLAQAVGVNVAVLGLVLLSFVGGLTGLAARVAAPASLALVEGRAT
jgi:hypothetical protein